MYVYACVFCIFIYSFYFGILDLDPFDVAKNTLHFLDECSLNYIKNIFPFSVSKENRTKTRTGYLK